MKDEKGQALDAALSKLIRLGVVAAFCPTCNCCLTLASETACDRCGPVDNEAVVYRKIAEYQPYR